MTSLVVRRLGMVPYQPTWRAMQRFTDERGTATPDELWLLEHPPVYTQGQAGRAEHLVDPGDIPVVQADRGGQVTYHGPGQLVAYLLLDLRRLGIGIRALVSTIEQAVVDVLAADGIVAAPRADAPGVYVDGCKIAALGLRVRRGCTFHGLAFNIAMDMKPFSRIDPCGLPGLAVTQVAEFVDTPLVTVAQRLEVRLAELLGYTERLAAAPPAALRIDQSASA